MTGEQTNEAEGDALRALAWIVGEGERAGRFLALTGLTPETLRASVGDPAVLAAAIRFLESHEPDLIACAGALSATPLELVDARRRLER